VLNVNLALQGDSIFVLRRIAGVTNCIATPANGGRFNYKNASGSYANGNGGTTGIVFPKNWPVVPEKVYSYNDQINFDLYQTLRAFNACGGDPIYTSVIAFQGVKRFPIGRGYPQHVTPYNYREVAYSYSYSLTVDWGYWTSLGSGIPTPARQFSVQMEQYDFELLSIGITKTAPTQGTGALVTDDFAISLMDQDRHSLSNLPLPQSYINSARPTIHQCPTYQGIMPVPSLVYPAGGAIVFNITSLKCPDADSTTYNLLFQGIWRIPTNASR
jgi:hypothetical protein